MNEAPSLRGVGAFQFIYFMLQSSDMSVRMRHTSGHTGNRRSHHALTGVKAVKDKESGNLRLAHRIDEATGMYRGKQIYSPKAKRVKGEKVKGVSAEPVAPHVHEHADAKHANAEVKSSRGVLGKLFKGEGRPKARSGFGGGA